MSPSMLHIIVVTFDKFNSVAPALITKKGIIVYVTKFTAAIPTKFNATAA